MRHVRHNVVGATSRRLRTEQRLRQEAISAKCDVAGFTISRGTLAKIEAEIRCATDLELFVISRSLKTTVEDLYPAKMEARLRKGEFFDEEA